MTLIRPCLFALAFFPSVVFSQSPPVRLAVAPFYSPSNGDYGLYIANRMACALHRRANVPRVGAGRALS